MDALRRPGRDQQLPQRQSGATAIEFAFVLPLLLALTYAMFVYAYVYVIYESINYAAQQGAESAVAVNPALDSTYLGSVQTYAQTTAQGVLSWLPESQRSQMVIDVLPCNASGGGASPYCPSADSGGMPIVVQITFPISTIFAVLNLPGIGNVPPLPATLVGVGVTLLSG
ncbi:TadE/TadG family type IV pilus assembly protein [Hydrocarboniphaga sp.]|uniref:TadE/TadG family type IV pilus assembly protein n=1 Tax=Hydrocarboniphaga sp. TaxID=2033016 RepID=UPI003D1338C3